MGALATPGRLTALVLIVGLVAAGVADCRWTRRFEARVATLSPEAGTPDNCFARADVPLEGAARPTTTAEALNRTEADLAVKERRLAEAEDELELTQRRGATARNTAEESRQDEVSLIAIYRRNGREWRYGWGCLAAACDRARSLGGSGHEDSEAVATVEAALTGEGICARMASRRPPANDVWVPDCSSLEPPTEPYTPVEGVEKCQDVGEYGPAELVDRLDARGEVEQAAYAEFVAAREQVRLICGQRNEAEVEAAGAVEAAEQAQAEIGALRLETADLRRERDAGREDLRQAEERRDRQADCRRRYRITVDELASAAVRRGRALHLADLLAETATAPKNAVFPGRDPSYAGRVAASLRRVAERERDSVSRLATQAADSARRRLSPRAGGMPAPLRDCGRLTEDDRSDATVRVQAGSACWEQRRYEEAAAHLEFGLRGFKPQGHDAAEVERACFRLADAQRMRGDLDAAFAVYRALAGDYLPPADAAPIPEPTTRKTPPPTPGELVEAVEPSVSGEASAPASASEGAHPTPPPAVLPPQIEPRARRVTAPEVCTTATTWRRLAAMGEVRPGREVEVQVRLSRERTEVDWSVLRPVGAASRLSDLHRIGEGNHDEDRPAARGNAVSAAAGPWNRLPGGLFGAARFNGRFLADVEPEEHGMAAGPSADTQRYFARFVFPNDDGSLWRYARDPAGTAAEIALPLWAPDARVQVEVLGRGVRLDAFRPAPSSGPGRLPDAPGGEAVDPPSGVGTTVAPEGRTRLGDVAGWEWQGGQGGGVTGSASIVVAGWFGFQREAVWWLKLRSPLGENLLRTLFAFSLLLAAMGVILRRRAAGPWVVRGPAEPIADLLQAGIVGALLLPAFGAPVVQAALHPAEAVLILGSPLTGARLILVYSLVGLGLAALLGLPRGRQAGSAHVRFLRHAGAAVFCFYLVSSLPTANWLEWVIVPLTLAPLVYYWLVRDPEHLAGLATIDPARLLGRRAELLDLAVERLQLHGSRKMLERWPALIAKGERKAADYQAARTDIDGLLAESDQNLLELGTELGISLTHERKGRFDARLDPDATDAPESASGHPVADAVLFLGPSGAPGRNAALALASGAVPVILLAVAGRSFQPVALVFSLAFFGAMFRYLRGRNGLQKGVLLGLSIGLLARLPALGAAADLGDLVGRGAEVLAVMMVLGFAGIAMDLASVGRHWRRLLRLYDSPTLTGLGSGALAAAVTAITTVLTGQSAALIQNLLGAAP